MIPTRSDYLAFAEYLTQDVPEPLRSMVDEEAHYEADRYRMDHERQTDPLSPARGIVLALALSLIAAGIIWGIWRML